MDLLRRVLRNNKVDCNSGVCAGDKDKKRRGGVRAAKARYSDGNNGYHTSQQVLVWSSVGLLIISVILLYVLLGLVVSQCNGKKSATYIISN